MNSSNRQLIGFVVYLWVLAFLALFGIEIKFFIYYAGNIYIPLVLLTLFIIAPLIIRRYLMHQLATNPKVYLKNEEKPVFVKYREAHQAIQTYVNTRAKGLGLENHIDVKYLPLTYNTIDAYVFGSDDHQTLVLSGGAQSMYLRGNAEQIEQFKFLIDHELGHIAENDTGLLYLARAILYSLCLFPIKLCLMLFIIRFGEGYFEDFASQILPSLYSGGYFFLRKDISDLIWVLILLLYHFGSIGLLCIFYFRVVRQREYVADNFAYKNSLNQKDVDNLLSNLLSYSSMKKQHPHAFSGNNRWHPSVKQRLANLKSKLNLQLPVNISIIGFLGLCLYFRYSFGLSLDDQLTTPYQLSILTFISSVFILLIGFNIDTVLSGYSSNKDTQKKWLPIFIATFWSVIIALFYLSIAFLFSDSESFLDDSGYFDLFRIERNETILLYFSLPITILVFGISFTLIQHYWKNYTASFSSYLFAIFVGSSFAVLVLAGLSASFNPILKNNNSELFETYNNTEPEQSDSSASSKEYYELKIDEKKYIKRNFENHSFQPPLCFIALWQGPFKGSVL